MREDENKKQRTVSSFKIGIPKDDKEAVMAADYWPEGIIVNEFLNLRRPVPLRTGQRTAYQAEPGRR